MQNGYLLYLLFFNYWMGSPIVESIESFNNALSNELKIK
jgi:hypothetical protein